MTKRLLEETTRPEAGRGAAFRGARRPARLPPTRAPRGEREPDLPAGR